MPNCKATGAGWWTILGVAAIFLLLPFRAEGRSIQLRQLERFDRFLRRITPIPAQENAQSLPPIQGPEAFANAAIISPSLLSVADSRSFRSSNWPGRVERIQRWIRRNAIGHFRTLDVNDRDLALRRIAKQLENLLAEKDFRVPKIRNKDRVASNRRSS
jgi:hypothetical protein